MEEVVACGMFGCDGSEVADVVCGVSFPVGCDIFSLV